MREARASRPWALVLGLLASFAAAVALVGPASAQVPSTDATLSGITISGRAIPGFSPSVLSHAVSVGYTVERATIIPTTADTNATVTYLDGNDMPLTDADTGTDDQDVDLVVGDTTVKMKVTAEDTTTVLTYTVTITRTEEDTSLSPPVSDPVAPFPSTAVYSVTFRGTWTSTVTPDGVPGGAHFSRLIGGVHDANVTFLESGEMASDGVESMAEDGGWTTLRDEVMAAGADALSVITGDTDSIGSTTSKTLTATLSAEHPRITLVTMVAPSPDWFVGVSGLPLLNADGRWLRSHEVNLYPWDAGTETGTEFSRGGTPTVPEEPISSIRGTGKFSTEPIATLTFTLQSVSTSRSVAENTAAGVDIGAPVVATDSSGMVTYTLGGTDADSFDIVASTGQLQTKAALDYETRSSYEVTVTATDSDGPTNIVVTVEVTNVDEPGSVSLFPALLQIRTVVRATLSDPEGVKSLVWRWARSADKSNWVSINGATQADYMPVDGDLGMYLHAVATYTDGEGSGKTAEGVSENVVGPREPAPELSVKVLVSGRSKPWGIAFAPDGTMLFTERGGKLSRRLADGTVRRVTAYLSDLSRIGNNGLMGIVVDPAFATNRRFYTCQGHTGPEVQVIAWTVDATYTTATRVSDPLVEDIASGGNHNGCRLRFGLDGYLYIATGDTETTGTVPQDLAALGGKVLRVDSTTGAAPMDNPFPGSLVYTYGHRNMQGLALRPGTSQVWSVEHGPRVDDEVNLLIAGANYGWDPAVTDAEGNPQPGYNDSGPMTDLRKFPDAKVARWSSGNATLATAGGIFLEGDQWGVWEGRLAVATLKDRTLHLFEFTEDGDFVNHVVPPELDHTHGRLRTPMLGTDGALYISTDQVNREVILRVTPQQAPEFADETDTQQVPENTGGTAVVATVEATDYNHDPLTYTLGGTDAASFIIPDPAVGKLQVGTGTRLDYETKATYEVAVTATDDQDTSDTITLTITVTDVEHEGTVALPSVQPQVGSPFLASLFDEDGDVTAATWTWARSDDGMTGWESISGADSASYTPVSGDAGKHLRATVTYTNTHGPGKTAQSITDGAVRAAPNSNPEFATGSRTRRVDEGTAAGRHVGLPVGAEDADSDPLEYALLGTDADLFDIDASSGQLLARALLDYEAENEYSVIVSVSDGKNINAETDGAVDDSVTVTIQVTNVDEAGTVALSPAQPRVRTVVRATLSDPDGDIRAVSWRWAASADGVSWTNLATATQADYAPTASDQGKYLQATALYTDGQGAAKAAEVVSDHVVGEREPAPDLTVVPLVSGLSVPWGIAFAPDGTMLFTERAGKLSSRLPDGTVQPVTADLSDLQVSGQIGLMGIAVDPSFTTNRQFYTCQGHTGPEVQVIRWTIDAAYTTATRISDPLVGGVPLGSQNGGCRLRFGPNGYLWIATGDAGVGTTPQDLSSLGGKVLRVDASTGTGAPGNPSGSRVYTYGHRNPQGLALRPGTSQMWAVEHGPTVDDEINLLVAGANYGWDPVPGYNESVPMTDLEELPDAVEARWSSGDPTLATSGAIFLQEADWEEWNGRLAVASLKDRSLRVFRFTSAGDFVSQVGVPELDGVYGRLRTPMLGPDGALYVATSDRLGGDQILKIVPSLPPRFEPSIDIQVLENSSTSAVVATVAATDPDSDALTYSLSGPDAASFNIANERVGQVRANASLDYETRSSYQIVITATDPYGLSDSLTLTIAVTDVNEPPVAKVDDARTNEDTATTIYVLRNDGDPENDTLSVSSVGVPSHGTATVDPNSTDIVYTPSDDYHGVDSFTYTVSAGSLSDEGTVKVTIDSVNDAPEFPADTVQRRVSPSAQPGENVGAPVTASDDDGAEDVLSYRLSGSTLFEIELYTAQITVAAGAVLDPAVQTEHTLTVFATDRANTEATVVVTIQVVAGAVSPIIIGGGGGGGGGPSGPSPSFVDFEWTVTRDIEELDSGHDMPSGAWSDGTTLWLAENGDGADDAVYAYDLESGERAPEREFALDERNRTPRGVWSDRVTVWVSDSGQNTLFAHDLESGERLPDADIALAGRNGGARGIWSGGRGHVGAGRREGRALRLRPRERRPARGVRPRRRERRPARHLVGRGQRLGLQPQPQAPLRLPPARAAGRRGGDDRGRASGARAGERRGVHEALQRQQQQPPRPVVGRRRDVRGRRERRQGLQLQHARLPSTRGSPR